MYNEFFGFSEDPFRLSPDPGFLYMAVGHWETLSSMMSGIKERWGIVAVTGDVGTGKTTLIYALLKDLSEKIKTAFIFNPHLTFKQLLKAILGELKVPVGGENTYTLLYKFDQYLNERLAKDETVVIIIDEAQAMSPKVLADLDRLFQQGPAASKILQILLVGQLELEAHLDSEELRQFKQRIAIHRRLPPLNREESKVYIDHRLKKVGSSSKIFTPKALDFICKSARGIPRVINLICDGALYEGYSASSRKIDSQLVREALVENDIIAEEEGVGEDEIAEEKVPFERQEASGQGKPLAKEEDIAAPEIAAAEKTPAEKEKIPEEKPAVDREVAPEKEPIGEKEIIAEKEAAGDKGASGEKEDMAGAGALEDIVYLRLRQGEEIRRSGSVYKKIGISASVAVGLAVLALVYWAEIRSLLFKEEEPVHPPAQARIERQEEKTIQVQEREEKIVKVENGWTLSLLAKRYYGSTNPTFIDLILEANPQISDPDLILVHQSVKIPEIREELLLIRASDATYRIYLGTFSDLSQVGVFQNEAVFEGKKLEIALRKFPSRGTWSRITAGEFKSKEEAIKAILALREKGLLPAFPEVKKKS